METRVFHWWYGCVVNVVCYRAYGSPVSLWFVTGFRRAEGIGTKAQTAAPALHSGFVDTPPNSNRAFDTPPNSNRAVAIIPPPLPSHP